MILQPGLAPHTAPVVTLSRANGLDFARILIPKPLVYAFGALLSACIIQSKAKQRLGSRSLIDNCCSGIAGQLALTMTLRYFGFDAKMIPPVVGPDLGYDVLFGSNATVEVRTSSFIDNRGVELMRHGDRFPLRSATFAPRIYAWCVTQPNFFAGASEMLYIDVVAVIPAGQVKPTTPRPVSAVPGMRLGDIDPKFSIFWLLKAFNAAREKQSLLGEMPSFENVGFDNILALPFVLSDVIGSSSNVAQTYNQNTLTIARTYFTILMRGIEATPSTC